mmetsp:Transcript_97253/g.208653  ORF Transcript_97253/g.208653 Transcript_97253/m.208653 type:complete len:140 (-) Transcript_97253:124-543(-)
METITQAELKRHGLHTDCWIAVHGLVYDVTAFMPDHPGGSQLIEDVGGMDASAEFEDALHSAVARKEPKMVFKGVLEGWEAQVESMKKKGWDESDGIPDPDQLRGDGGSTLVGPAGVGILVLAATGAVVLAWLLSRRKA